MANSAGHTVNYLFCLGVIMKFFIRHVITPSNIPLWGILEGYHKVIYLSRVRVSIHSVDKGNKSLNVSRVQTIRHGDCIIIGNVIKYYELPFGRICCYGIH